MENAKSNKMRISKLLMFVIMCAIGTSCFLNYRLSVENALRRIMEIRHAEIAYYRSNGGAKYGTLDELAAGHLVADGVTDGVEMGYSFELKVEGPTYSLSVNPLKEDHGDSNTLSFFVDETGVIRSSNEANVPANKFSQKIGNQE